MLTLQTKQILCSNKLCIRNRACVLVGTSSSFISFITRATCTA